MRALPIAIFLAVASFAAPKLALANGRFPATNQIVFFPSAPDRVVLRTTFGLLLSKDRGSNWDWICERSIGYSGTEDPATGITANGTILAGLFDGLSVSKDTGCSWGKLQGSLERQVIIDVAVRRDDPRIAIALTSTFKGQSDAGDSLFSNVLYVTQDDGASWQAIGQPLDSTLLAETVDFASSDGTRLYVSGVRDKGQLSTGVLLVSTDSGLTWTERVVPLVEGERAPFIAAVDPVDASRVYIRAGGSGPARLLYTEDAGVSFKVAFVGTAALQGFALSGDGSKIYVGSAKDGLHIAARADMAFKKKSEVQVQCLAMSGTTLWACSNMVSGFVVGSSEDDGATFTPKLKLDGIRGPLACSAGTSGDVCVTLWPTLRDTLGVGQSQPSDAGADAGTPGGNSGGGGCQVSPAAGWLAGAVAVALAGGALIFRRRRRR